VSAASKTGTNECSNDVSSFVVPVHRTHPVPSFVACLGGLWYPFFLLSFDILSLLTTLGTVTDDDASQPCHHCTTTMNGYDGYDDSSMNGYKRMTKAQDTSFGVLGPLLCFFLLSFNILILLTTFRYYCTISIYSAVTGHRPLGYG
jgi:hypothetical protein